MTAEIAKFGIFSFVLASFVLGAVPSCVRIIRYESSEYRMYEIIALTLFFISMCSLLYGVAFEVEASWLSSFAWTVYAFVLLMIVGGLLARGVEFVHIWASMSFHLYMG